MQKHYLTDIVEPVVQDLGYEVVRIMTIGEANPVLQIMIEHKDYNKELTIDDCTIVSKSISSILDEKDPIESQYTLEVSSPGLDRPLTKIEHFSRYKGYVIKLETAEAVEKRKRFKGVIEDVSNEGQITLSMDGVQYDITFDNVAKAKIVLTDELWAQYLKAHKDNQS